MNNQNNIKSPITGSTNCTKIYSYPKQSIINSYLYDLKIDVSQYFSDIDTLNLYQCQDTGLRFFIPNNIEGQSSFYEQLQKHAWYYLPLKWEHRQTFKYLPSTGKLLEIGCANGAFLSLAKEKGLEVEGIELNAEAVKAATSSGHTVYNMMLSEYLANDNHEKFDVVCAYQVLEHIADVRQFLNDAIACLKPGGILLISVPDMNTFLKYDDGGILNFPPHHQGWYTHKIMQNIQKYFPLSLIQVSTENLQKEHYNWFHKSMIKKWYKLNSILGSIYFRSTLNLKIRSKIIQMIAPFIKGHTMLAVYQKK
jgi:2-polyprenyl-3-methyl-5-hydroxy-6-metoxy-1,4-benzoquinol methylase